MNRKMIRLIRLNLDFDRLGDLAGINRDYSAAIILAGGGYFASRLPLGLVAQVSRCG